MTIEFGERLRHYIAQSGLSQSEVARRSGVHPSHVCRAAAGERRVGTETAQQLAYVLNVPEENLAEFLLYAAGHSLKKNVARALGQISLPEPNSDVLSGGFE